MKPLGAKLLKNQEESLKDMSDCQMEDTLGKRGTMEETNDIPILDTDCEDVEAIICNQGF